jgi:hypothetical protein
MKKIIHMLCGSALATVVGIVILPGSAAAQAYPYPYSMPMYPYGGGFYPGFMMTPFVNQFMMMPGMIPTPTGYIPPSFNIPQNFTYIPAHLWNPAPNSGLPPSFFNPSFNDPYSPLT